MALLSEHSLLRNGIKQTRDTKEQFKAALDYTVLRWGLANN
jgi:hypothetical protein